MSGPDAAPMEAKGARCNGRTRFRLLDASTFSVDWGSTTSVVQWCEVISARSKGNHTEIATLARVLKVHCPLREVVQALTCLGLVQLRRDLAVNADRVRRLVGGGRHRLIVVLEDGACVRVGRQFQRDIRARFGPQRANRLSTSVATKHDAGGTSVPPAFLRDS